MKKKTNPTRRIPKVANPAPEEPPAPTSDQYRRQTELLQTVLDNIPVMITMYDAQGRMLLLNKEFERLIGWSLEEATKLDLMEVVYPDPECRKKAWEYMQSARPGWHNFKVTTKNGAVVDSSWTSVRLSDGSQVGIGVDTGGLKQAEKALKRRMTDLSALNTMATIISQSLQETEVVNRALDEVLQLLDIHTAGILLLDEGAEELTLVAHRGLSDQFVQAFSRIKLGEGLAGKVAQTGKPIIMRNLEEYPQARRAYLAKDHIQSAAVVPIIGTTGVIGTMNLAASTPQYFDRTGIELMINMGRQIAVCVERARLHTAVQESEARFRAMAERSADCIVTLDETGTVTYASPGLVPISGYTPDEVVGQVVFEYLHPEDLGRAMEIFQGLLQSPAASATTEVRMRHRAGGWRWLEVTATNLRAKSTAGGIVLNFHDITERKRAEEALRTRISELDALFTLSSNLRQAQTPEEVLQLLLKEARRVMNADEGLVVRHDPDGEHFIIAAAEGHLAPHSGRTFGIEEGVSGQILRTGQPYVTDDYAADPHTLVLEHGEEVGPAAFVPLKSEKTLLGVLMVGRGGTPEAQPFSSDEVRLLVAMGEMASTALRRMASYADALRRLKTVQALRKIDMAITSSLDPRVTLQVLLDEVTTQLAMDAAAVLLLNPHSLTLEFTAGRGFHYKTIRRSRLRLGEGFVGRAALEHRPLAIPDLRQAEDFGSKQLLLDEGFLAYAMAPMISKGRLLGVLETFLRTPFHGNSEWQELMEALAGQAAIAIENARLFADLERSNVNLSLAYDATIEGWSRAMDLRDEETEGHTQRVTEMTVQLAREMGMSEEQIVHVRRGALLHDMGKVGIPDSILLKPDKLTEEEWEIMRQHPQYAYNMLAQIEYLHPALDIPWCHHEKWDGTGYPRGLKGEQIPLAARLFAVVDVWDALRSDRPYRQAWPEEKVREYIREQSGKHFDPQVIELFLSSTLAVEFD